MAVISVPFDHARLKRQIRRHLKQLGFVRDNSGRMVPAAVDKETYRALHSPQRRERVKKERAFIERAWPALAGYFAEGNDIRVESIRVRLELIKPATWQSDLFRLASLIWSIPVSQGFGRRLRFLVWDDSNYKLIGLFALGDPVFNLKARDEVIGWNWRERSKRLVLMLDAYVLGAVPPYNRLIAGKLIASLIRTREVVSAFEKRYRKSYGVISGKAKNAQLAAVTTTSALGRSSLYNRLKLDGRMYFTEIGFTSGYGHFHFPDGLFKQMRAYLRFKKDAYAANHTFGQGPNWRLRTIRRTLELIGLDPSLMKHGLRRQVFLCTVADNALAVLRGHKKRARYDSLLSVDEVSNLALARWVRPRAQRDQSYRDIVRPDILRLITEGVDLQLPALRGHKSVPGS